ncbi:hypothetical protein TruAng_000157 [Truncatella angustata]|nr:hypothetical protein TruAng_000157 [Truncatella angustata]
MAHPSKARDRPSRPKKAKPPNAVEVALNTWFASLPEGVLADHNIQALVAQAPKGWSVYEPMVLLPAGSFTSEAWRAVLEHIPSGGAADLWERILANIPKPSRHAKLTHLAANEGIPLHSGDGAEENILRSPIGLRTLYGDFGPSAVLDAAKRITPEDLDKAFWVSTTQNGIYQKWAPRWTMFSRGNVKEKARLLDFHKPSPSQSRENRVMSQKALKNRWAVDLYAGIGYFTFSYAKLGLHVLCWELNPWSVAGLKQAASPNGFDVRVIEGEDLQNLDMRTILAQPSQITVFVESNVNAKRRIDQLRKLGGELDMNDDGDPDSNSGIKTKSSNSSYKSSDSSMRHSDLVEEDEGEVRSLNTVEVLHINGGFLPTSEPTWQDAWNLVREGRKAWLHLHENVGVNDIEKRKAEILQLFDGFCTSEGLMRHITVEHVEQVKTFAPGVWHCVFDVYITR